jgi:hypothetical protein
MPKLARRLSNSSHEAFEEFCKENQPLSRRLSHGGFDGASSMGSSANFPRNNKKEKGQEILLKKRRSMTSSQPFRSTRRSTKVSGDPTGNVPIKSDGTTPPKTTRSQTKENGHDEYKDIIQSPTPYWKVAKERGGIHSPPTTRAAKKHKTGRALTFHTNDRSQQQEGLMIFSPPNQVANFNREKMERERKNMER